MSYLSKLVGVLDVDAQLVYNFKYSSIGGLRDITYNQRFNQAFLSRKGKLARV